MALIGIVARARNQAIGLGNSLPWHFPADLKFFKTKTLHHACVMGRRTWETMPRPLPKRLNIVLSRSLAQDCGTPPPSAMFLHYPSEVLSLEAFMAQDVYIIGGAEIYRLFAPHISKWLVTEIPLDAPDADTFFPAECLAGCTLAESVEIDTGLIVNCYERTT